MTKVACQMILMVHITILLMTLTGVTVTPVILFLVVDALLVLKLQKVITLIQMEITPIKLRVA